CVGVVAGIVEASQNTAVEIFSVVRERLIEPRRLEVAGCRIPETLGTVDHVLEFVGKRSASALPHRGCRPDVVVDRAIRIGSERVENLRDIALSALGYRKEIANEEESAYKTLRPCGGQLVDQCCIENDDPRDCIEIGRGGEIIDISWVVQGGAE